MCNVKRWLLLCTFIDKCLIRNIAENVLTSKAPKFNEKNGKANVVQILQEITALCSNYPTELEKFQILYDKLENLRYLQPKHAALQSTADQRRSKLPIFQQWCSNKINGIKINDYADMGLGLETTRNITQHETVITIDLDDAIKFQDTEIYFERFRYIIMPRNAMYPAFWQRNLFLALYLCSLRLNDSSQWSTYLETLPTTFNTPHYFDPEAMTYLNGSLGVLNSLWSIHEMVYIYGQVHLYLYEHPMCCTDLLLKPETFTFDLFRWAFVISLSRVYMAETGLMLFPCWDMLNHHHKSMLTTEVKNNKLVARAIDNIPQGVQITQSYNDLRSTVIHFFNTWGIVEPLAAYFVLVELRSTNVLYRLRRALLAVLNLDLGGAWIRVVQHQHLPIETNDYNFLVVMATAHNPRKGTITQSAWRKMWQFFSRCVQKQKSKQQYSETELEKLLRKSRHRLSSNSQIAISVLLAEHKVLSNVRKQLMHLSMATNN